MKYRVSGLLLAALSAFSTASAEPTPVRLALNWKAEPEFGGFYAAVENKDDLKAGIKLTLLEGGSGTPTVQMLANSQIDFAIVSAEEILISNQRNLKNKVVGLFAVYQTNPQIIMCHAERGFKSLQEVFGASVTLALQSGLTYAQYLRRKFPSPKAKLVPYNGGVTTFLADRNFCQQGFLMSEPIAAEKSGAKVSTFLVADEGFNPYTTVLAAREETLKKNPELVRKVVAAVRAGWQTYLKDAGPTNKVMHNLNKAMDLDTFNKSAEAQRRLIGMELGKMKSERWQQLAETLKSLHVIDSVPAPTSSFAEGL